MPVRARKIVFIVLPVLIIVFLVAYLIFLFNYPNVYTGVTILGNDLKKLDYNLTVDKIRNNFSSFDKKIIFEYNHTTFEIPWEMTGVEIDYLATAKNAFEYGKSGNIFKRLKDIFVSKTKGVNLPLKVRFDVAKLEKVMKENLADFIAKDIDNKFELNNDKISVTNGKEGMAINMADLIGVLKNNISNYNLDTPNVVKITLTKPSQISYETLKGLFEAETRDFEYYQKNGRFLYVPSSVGISIDKSICEKILSDNKTNELPYDIPVKVTFPQKSIKYFSDNYIIDTLGSFSTVYNSSNTSRSENIRIASQKINGYLIEPGGEFSFNKVVGKRDEQSGFKTAKVYQSGEVVDGIGGGICQVSSTLFNAVLYADMEIVKRTNHSMPVTYVSAGRDATVSYDYIDFVFRNNKSYPVRIDSVAMNGNITCSVMGINEDNKSVEITTEIIKKIPYGTKVKKTSELIEGKSRIIKAGQEGVKVNTYKTVSINGVKTERQWLCESYYAPVDALVEVGTRNVVAPKPEIIPDKKQKNTMPQISSNKIIQYPLPE